jgi:hypothetical protein
MDEEEGSVDWHGIDWHALAEQAFMTPPGSKEWAAWLAVCDLAERQGRAKAAREVAKMMAEAREREAQARAEWPETIWKRLGMYAAAGACLALGIVAWTGSLYGPLMIVGGILAVGALFAFFWAYAFVFGWIPTWIENTIRARLGKPPRVPSGYVFNDSDGGL